MPAMCRCSQSTTCARPEPAAGPASTADLRSSLSSCNARTSADEHTQTSVSVHGDRHSPQLAGAQTAQKQHAGPLEVDAQPSAARIRLPEGAARKVSASVRRACIPDTSAASRPNRGPGRILIPGDGAAGDQGPRIGLPARQWRLRDACGLSRLNDFLALWSQAYMSSCNRQVTSTSIHMARPGPVSVPRGHAPLYADTLSLARTISDRRI